MPNRIYKIYKVDVEGRLLYHPVDDGGHEDSEVVDFSHRNEDEIPIWLYRLVEVDKKEGLVRFVYEDTEYYRVVEYAARHGIEIDYNWTNKEGLEPQEEL